jgi:hypothetical protein
MKTKIRTYQIRTYDVWGNVNDGFEVNDIFSHGTVSIVCKQKIYNAGTPNQFEDFEPTDRQLSIAAGFGVSVSWDGQDGTFIADKSSNGMPVGELVEITD